MITQRAVAAIEASDTDDLLRVIDGYCKEASWDDLVELRRHCREALTRGKQLWGVDEHIRYRLALEAPPANAGPVVSEGPSRFGLGPLPEVAASTKTWRQMEPHLEYGPERSSFAAERVVRREEGVEAIPDLPNRLYEWEPRYRLATYKADKVEAPSPKAMTGGLIELDRSSEVISDADSEGALADLVQAWTTESNGRCQTVTVEGRAATAIAALGLRKAGITEIPPGEALAWMAWAAGSGGAHGRRRGAAAGRFGAWWVMAALADLDWPPHPDALEKALSDLRFFWFDDGSPGTGWQLRMSIADRVSGLAWAISALDSAD